MYLPVAPWVVLLAARYRGLALPAAANPGIYLSGIRRESKSEILEKFAGQKEHFARFDVIRKSSGGAVLAGFPVVLKPDHGERGKGVEVIRSPEEAERYLERADSDIIAQEYVGGVEFGVFYYRLPGADGGVVSSITRKTFPVVTGDGSSTLEELIWNGRRTVYLAPKYLAQLKVDPGLVLGRGEELQLIEIGSHSRGAIFEDATWLKTAELARSLDEVLADFPGFHFGRFDLRSPSVEAFQRGEFRILELNGLTSEPTHIYDPRLSSIAAYGALFHHWHAAFRIGAANRDLGVRVPGLGEVWRAVWS
jgi:hypothetical protein